MAFLLITSPPGRRRRACWGASSDVARTCAPPGALSVSRPRPRPARARTLKLSRVSCDREIPKPQREKSKNVLNVERGRVRTGGGPVVDSRPRRQTTRHSDRMSTCAFGGTLRVSFVWRLSSITFVTVMTPVESLSFNYSTESENSARVPWLRHISYPLRPPCTSRRMAIAPADRRRRKGLRHQPTPVGLHSVVFTVSQPTPVGLPKRALVDVRRRVDVRMNTHVLLSVARARMDEVAAPHEHVAHRKTQQHRVRVVAAVGEDPQFRPRLHGEQCREGEVRIRNVREGRRRQRLRRIRMRRLSPLERRARRPLRR